MSAIALVTGGNRGIGSAIAKSLKAAGYTVIVTYRSGSAPADFESVQLDVTSTESVDAAFALIEEKKSITEIAKNFDKTLVQKVAKLLHISEYKRRQSCLGPKISDMAFDKDRRYPVTNRFTK